MRADRLEGTVTGVFGLGRSGLAVARAVIAKGGKAIVFDQNPQEKLNKPELVEAARALGAEVRLGWDAGFEGQPIDRLVTNPAVDHRHPWLRGAVLGGLDVWSEVEFASRIARAKIVGITGTNGKSTTTVMTWLALRGCGVDAVLCGNIFGSGYPEQPLTDAALEAREDQILVAEISSFQLEWVDRFLPVSAAITTITPDHQERYDRFEDYAATKQRIFRAMGTGDFAVIRAHDPVVKRPATGPRVLTFGALGEHAEYDEVNLRILDRTVKLDSLPFREAHNLANASAAALLAFGALVRTGHPSIAAAQADARSRKADRSSIFGSRAGATPLADALPGGILDGLREFRGLAHRMELVGERDGVRFINNSMCTNPDAVLKSVQSVKDPVRILMGGVNKELDFAPLRHYLANQRHSAYLFGRDRGPINEMIGGIGREFETMPEAFAAAAAEATRGEVVMLAPGCASMDQFRDFRHRGDVFREIAKEWLER